MTDAASFFRLGVPQVFPAGVLYVQQGDKTLLWEAAGMIAEGIPTGRNTVFDLASLTKPLVTVALLMLLVDRKIMSTTDVLGKHFPAVRGGWLEKTTLADLLSHRAGLPPWRPWGEKWLQRKELPSVSAMTTTILKDILALEPICPGQAVYSDLGYILLGWMLQHLLQSDLNEAFIQHIAVPLSLEHTLFLPVGQKQPPTSHLGTATIAPTEYLSYRKGLIQGEVHDDNAFVLGGIAGHAGLFSDVIGISKILSAMLTSAQKDHFWTQKTIQHFWNWKNPPSTWRLGFDTPSETNSSCGQRHPKGLVGHLGFTGCSFWIHPQTQTQVVMLTNRVHPSRENEKIRSFRPQIHDLIWDGMME